MVRPESSASWIASTYLYLSQKYSNLKIRIFARFEFSAVAKAPSAPPSTSPSAPRSSYELAGGPTLKVSGSINGPDQALISLMRHQGQPLRLEPLVWLFYLIQAVSERLFVVLDGFWSSGCIGVQRRSFAGEGRTWLPEILLHMPSSHFFSTTVFSSTRVSPMCNVSPYVRCAVHTPSSPFFSTIVFNKGYSHVQHVSLSAMCNVQCALHIPSFTFSQPQCSTWVSPYNTI